jgi:hypothetical protein
MELEGRQGIQRNAARYCHKMDYAILVYVHDVRRYIFIDHYEQEGHQILLETHEVILGLANDFDYSQAMLIYGARMEAAATSKVEFDQTLEIMRARMADIRLHAISFSQ